MNLKPAIYLLFGLLMGATSALAQYEDPAMEEVMELKWKKKAKVADLLFEMGSYYNAIEIYKKVDEEKPQRLDIAYKIASASYLMRDYNQAEEWYKKMFAIDSTSYPSAMYYYAKSLKRLGKYTEAKAAFEGFEKLPSPKKATDEYNAIKEAVEKDIEGCDLGIMVMGEPEKVVVTNLGTNLNHVLSDYAPFPMGDDQLLFAALSNDSLINLKDTSLTNPERYTRLFVSNKEDDDTWGKAELYDQSFNKGDFHIVNGMFSPDMKLFFFTRCVENQDLTMHCNIFYSKNEEGVWSEAMEASALNGKKYTTTQPYLVEEDGELVMYYASNKRAGDEGDEGDDNGMDIWMARVNATSGNTGSPVNLTGNINTVGDEVTPFYDVKTKTLYFSSNGHVGIGGLDVYSSMKDEEGNWGEPVHMGYPVNSSVDDLYFRFTKTSNKGYLSSNRGEAQDLKHDNCCDDIFSYVYPPTIVTLQGKLLDGESGDPIEGAGFVYVYDAENDSLIGTFDVKEDGTYNFKLKGGKQYNIVASGERYRESTIAVDTEDAEEGEVINNDFRLGKRDYWAGMKIGIVNYGFNRSDLEKKAKNELDNVLVFMNRFPEVELELAGHTDSIDTEEYNQKLSERRAKSAFDYLTRKGIDTERLEAVGYSENTPVAPNSKDGKDNPEGRAANRRTEFVIKNNQGQKSGDSELEEFPDEDKE